MLDLFQAVILGAIQGITAWIPVSSKTQVILAGAAFFSLTFQTCIAFALILHVGDLVAALFRYRKEYIGAAMAALKPKELAKFEKKSEEQQEYSFLVISIIATAVVALPAYILMKKFFVALDGEWLLAAVGILLLVMAAITLLSKKAVVKNAQLDLSTSVIAGFAQGLAVVPGISRSGITQCTLLLAGFEPQKAVRLSFLMSAPMVAAAFLAFYFVEGFSGFTIEVIAVGILVAAIASYFTMGILVQVARKIPSHYFLAAVGLLAMVPLAIKVVTGTGG
jgi:undecaprenyl-diphosphatase